MDSLLALEIVTDLEGTLDRKIPAMAVASGPSIHEVVVTLGRHLREDAAAAQAGA
jgi:acyl carrier protein